MAWSLPDKDIFKSTFFLSWRQFLCYDSPSLKSFSNLPEDKKLLWLSLQTFSYVFYKKLLYEKLHSIVH